MKKYKVGVVGCTGMVGQRFITLLENHPWFQLTAIAASARSAGKPYEEAVSGRWKMDTPIPEEAKQLVIYDIDAQMKEFTDQIDFTFCAVDMDKDATRALEERIAKMECPVVSNNSAHRFTPDVPMVVPEINPEHIQVIAASEAASGHPARLHRRQVQLLPPELRPRPASSAGEVRRRKGAGLHLSGHLRRRQDL